MKSWTFVSPTSDKRCVTIRIEATLMEVATRSQQTHGMTSLPSRHAPSSQPTPRGERIVQPHIRIPPQPRVLAPPPRVHQPNQPTLSLPTSNAWIHHHHCCSRHQRSSAQNPQISRTSRGVGWTRACVSKPLAVCPRIRELTEFCDRPFFHKASTFQKASTFRSKPFASAGIPLCSRTASCHECKDVDRRRNGVSSKVRDAISS